MKVQCLSSDIISTLPQDIIENILSFLPIRDAIRTSILSKKWRYSWASIPALKFDEDLFEVSSNSNHYKKYKYVNAIFHVLLLHRGPLLKFVLRIGELNMTFIDQIIPYLSMSNTLKTFFIMNSLDKEYKLPSSLFSFQPLEKLQLESCALEPPLTFNGLSKLRILIFYYVGITAKMLQRLLINCPRLKKFALLGYHEDFIEGNDLEFTIAELFECLPSIVHLEISEFYIEYFVAGGMPLKLSTSLAHLKIIYVDVCFIGQDVISFLLCLIRSSPHLEEIYVLMYDDQKLLGQQASVNFPDLQDYSSDILNHLEYLEIEGFGNLPSEMEFVKLIMAKSPMLKKVQIKLHFTVSVDEELEMFRDLLRQPFPRASPSAKFIVER